MLNAYEDSNYTDYDLVAEYNSGYEAGRDSVKEEIAEHLKGYDENKLDYIDFIVIMRTLSKQ